MATLRVAYITTTPTDAVPLISAVESLKSKYGEMFQVQSLTLIPQLIASPISDEYIRFAKQSHITILHLMGDFPEYNQLVSTLNDVGVPVFVGTSFFAENQKYHEISTVEQADYQRIFLYINHSGAENFENLLLYLANRFTGSSYDVAPIKRQQWEGIYHPDFKNPPTLDEYSQKKIKPNKPTVGIWFNQTSWQSGDLDAINSLIREIELQGANALPVFFHGTKNAELGTHGFDWVVDNYFIKDGKPIVDAVISLLGMTPVTLPGPEGLEALKKLGVTVIKAILTVNTFETWRDTLQGLNVMDIPTSVAFPEFDGFLITVPIGAMSFSRVNPLTGTRVISYDPIPERISKVVRLTINWAKLRHISNSEKKVAIIFHNYPPRNDTIGKAFAIDTAVSVLHLLENMNAKGFTLGNIPKDSKELMDIIINGLTNDRRWLNADELAKRAIAKITPKQYTEWFSKLPVDVQERMEKQWGKPPGKVFSYNGNLLVAGLKTGNIYIGLQPPRGFLDDPAAIYHSPDLPPPYHYIAYYSWIRNVFKANVIIHVGTHGSLEWLPGKSVGLSESCYPDIAISDLPNVYPYVITNPGEGTQAKRRSYCCIVDYLIPVMHNADTYEELVQLEVQLQEYYNAKAAGDKSKLPISQKLIWAKVVESKLDKDLLIAESGAFADFDAFLERLHAYLHELSDSQIRDGLHVLGEPPTGSRLAEFLVTLTRLSNGAVPSLRQSVAEMKGYDYEYLLANKGKLCPDGRTNGDVIAEINTLALEFMEKFDAVSFCEYEIESLARSVFGGISVNVRRCLTWVSSFLVPALAKSTDEIANTIASCEGSFVPPGPSGSITRGMADILPTGRNFYSVDPRTIPTAAAWKVGVALGDSLLERHLKEEGKYPESIGIILWAIPTMKTRGDDVAEILYLMGVRPVWEESSGIVTGLELIPLKELKRPRIDVTVRISGLFRDTFPNIVHIIDDAVTTVASLKEKPDKNYLAKHVAEEVKTRISQGLSFEQAKEESSFRIFGDQPAAYGCGVSDAIDTKNWKAQKDLGDVYIIWGAYAFSRKRYGMKVPEVFKTRLSKLDVAVKNDDSREYDLFDGDDWYDYLGGMVNSGKVFGGKAPKSYLGDSSDPDRVKTRSTAEETCHVFRSRLLNPKYINSLKRFGIMALRNCLGFPISCWAGTPRLRLWRTGCGRV